LAIPDLKADRTAGDSRFRIRIILYATAANVNAPTYLVNPPMPHLAHPCDRLPPVAVLDQQVAGVTQLGFWPLPLRASSASGLVVESCVGLDRVSQ